ncbi:peptidoglycan DD-metalloendopeptidase family protein [Desulfitibacter alkalitolerans]|uniref:peptidoglycan DD-metalloendopeptidase family protein n=1 Tax=Desulfitibacter alkalitolerans TaxID=264641 RepID=UPI000688337F|nr:M23 family metallopeptidase [Desulfitibacter alkalitolerans]
MYHHKLKMILGILLGIFMVIAFTASDVSANDINTMTQQLLSSGQVDPDTAARVNTYTALYQVKPGDTLWDIAYKYGTDWEIIAAMNNLSQNSIRPGQVLVLPVEREVVYTVQRGDFLNKIAGMFNVTVDEIARVNGIKNPNILAIGQELIIPGVQNSFPVASSDNTRLRSVATANRGSAVNFLWPCVGQITSTFGPRNNGFHHGLDIAAPRGVDVKAARSGRVEFAGWLNVYGRTVIINHGNGYQTLYAHNNQLLVREGQNVVAGERIATIGATGNATGPHVHFEVIVDGKRVDPMRFLRN